MAGSKASHGIKYTQKKMGLDTSGSLWPNPFLRAGPTLKINQVLQRVFSLAVFFLQTQSLSSRAKQPWFLQKCPFFKVLPGYL